jgi:hypothetical protein
MLTTTIAVTVLCGIQTFASGPAGVYAIVEKVIFEPNDKAPQRIQIWGVFSASDGKAGGGYLPPQRGYLYFGLPIDRDLQALLGVNWGTPEAALAEWSDLKKVAGTGVPVVFGERHSWVGRVRKSSEKADDPDRYPAFSGLTRLGSPVNTPVISELKKAAAR